jgi:tetratricopeptide (TPR) repeat protein
MRLFLLSVACLAALFGAAPPAYAGLYNEGSGLGSRPDVLPTLTYDHLFFAELRAAPTPIDVRGSRREIYLRQQQALEKRRRDGGLSPIERADLGACYLRLGKTQQALRVLTAGDRQHFLVQANLATAYFVDGQLELALRHQRQLLETAWPQVWAGWSFGHLSWYRRVEFYFLRLIQSRLEEANRTARGGFGPRALPIDAIFPGLRLPARDRYVAGGGDVQVADHLPPSSIEILLQLLFWLPGDYRLYWQVGEIYNASGQVDVAAAIFEDIARRELAGSFQDLVRHRQVLAGSVKAFQLLFREIDPATGRLRLHNRFALLTALTPRGLPAPPGVGSIAQETASLAPLVLAAQPVQQAKEEPPAPETSVVAPAWRNVGLGFVVGALVTALFGLQWQQWRRRRAMSLPAPPEPEVEGPLSPPLPAEERIAKSAREGN